jgi:hypothetical protein
MSVVTTIYPQFKYDLLTKAVSWTADTINCALFSAGSYTATDTTYTTSGTEVASANGYTTGGGAVGTRTTSTATTTPNLCKITGTFGGGSTGTTTWTATGSGFTATAAKLYDTTVSNHPICYVDFGGSQTASGGGTFVISWDSTNGVFSLA